LSLIRQKVAPNFEPAKSLCRALGFEFSGSKLDAIRGPISDANQQGALTQPTNARIANNTKMDRMVSPLWQLMFGYATADGSRVW
jgi:hypothetical protein